MFDLPDPFGPTIAVTPCENSISVLSAKVLNPVSWSRLRCKGRSLYPRNYGEEPGGESPILAHAGAGKSRGPSRFITRCRYHVGTGETVRVSAVGLGTQQRITHCEPGRHANRENRQGISSMQIWVDMGDNPGEHLTYGWIWVIMGVKD